MSAAQGMAYKLRTDAAPTGAGRRARRSHSSVAAPYRAARLVQGGVSIEGGLVGGCQLTEERVAARPLRAAARDAEPVRPLSTLPESSIGLYDPSRERDSCGVGFVAELSGDYKRATVSGSSAGSLF